MKINASCNCQHWEIGIQDGCITTDVGNLVHTHPNLVKSRKNSSQVEIVDFGQVPKIDNLAIILSNQIYIYILLICDQYFTRQFKKENTAS